MYRKILLLSIPMYLCFLSCNGPYGDPCYDVYHEVYDDPVSFKISVPFEDGEDGLRWLIGHQYDEDRYKVFSLDTVELRSGATEFGEAWFYPFNERLPLNVPIDTSYIMYNSGWGQDTELDTFRIETEIYNTQCDNHWPRYVNIYFNDSLVAQTQNEFPSEIEFVKY